MGRRRYAPRRPVDHDGSQLPEGVASSSPVGWRRERPAAVIMTGVMRSTRQRSDAAAVSFAEAVEQVPFLRALPAADLERLRPYATCRRAARGARIWAEGEATGEFIFVVRGRAKLVKASEAGRETILHICGGGQLLCASAVCAFAPYCCSAVGLEGETDVVVLPRRDVLEVLERSPAASRAFLREVTGREVQLVDRIAELSSGQVERRITTLLLRLAEQVGVERPEGTWIGIALARQDLADLCATTLETAIRVMTRLARDEVLRTESAGFLIKDRRRLEAIARG
jgi:CRP/FNR family transcriptional regulator